MGNVEKCLHLTFLISQPTLLPLKIHMLHPQNHYLTTFCFLFFLAEYSNLHKKKKKKKIPSTLSPLKAPGRCAEDELGIMEFAVGKPADDSGTRPRVNSCGSRHPFISRWRCGRASRTSRQDKHSLEHGHCEEWKCLAAAARAWSWFPSWGSWCCSCVAAPKVGELGRPAPGSCLAATAGVHTHWWRQEKGEANGNCFSKKHCLILLFYRWGAA